MGPMQIIGIILFAVMIIAVIIAIVLYKLKSKVDEANEASLDENPQLLNELPKKQELESKTDTVVVKEKVRKFSCEFCGAKYNSSLDKCPHCNANTK